MNKNIAVLGAGAWGTTLAKYLCEQGNSVRLWAFSQAEADEINERHVSTKLKGVALPENLRCHTSAEVVLQNAEVVVSVVVSHALRGFLRQNKSFFPKEYLLLSATKGMETETGKRMSELITEELAPPAGRLAVLSGPNLAVDVANGLPVVSVVASESGDTREFFKELLQSKKFRIYTNSDVAGVEINGAMKNVLAIAAGICSGMKLGQSIRAGIAARAMCEIWRVSTALGADARTSMGVAGIGDIILTCTSETSRNHRFGERIGAGESIAEILKNPSSVAEGTNTVIAVHNLSKKLGLETPVCETVYKIIYESMSPREGLDFLLLRKSAAEFDE